MPKMRLVTKIARENDKNLIRLNKLISIFEDSKWSDSGPLTRYEPKDEKYITRENLLQLLDSII